MHSLDQQREQVYFAAATTGARYLEALARNRHAAREEQQHTYESRETMYVDHQALPRWMSVCLCI